MEEIRNLDGKLVCRVDEKAKVIEIVHKNYKTLIYFKPDGTTEVVNIEVA